jgi:hypothetical protein
LIAFWVFGLVMVPRYGLTWDEPLLLRYADAVWDYIVSGDRRFLTFDDRYHGMWYSVWMKFVGELPWIGSVSEAYMWRHAVNFSFFCLGGVGFYWVLLKMGISRFYAAMGVVLLLGHPRLWGHAIGNMKDIPFMVMWVFSTAGIFWFHDKPSAPRGALLGCLFGATIALRVVGALLAVVWCVVFAWRYRDRWKSVLSVVLNSIGALVLMWPLLWENPLRLFEAALGMSRYHWEGTVLYRGEFVWSTDLPWHYSVTWMGITTPVLYVILLVCAAFKSARWLKSEGWDPRWVWMVTWAVVPVVLVSVSGAHLYDGWRHLYFVAPAWVALCVFGIPRRLRAWIVGVLCGVTVVLATVQMFPYQSSFFNSLTGDKDTIRFRYEQDYWGSSYFECLNAILALDYRSRIPVYAANAPGRYNALLLSDSDRRRLDFVETLGEADYFVGNFRWHPDDYSPMTPLYSVERNGMTLAVVYALR